MLDKIHNLYEILSTPLTNWVQMEISTYCTASCIYCPHTIYKQKWREENMSIETFKKVLPALSHTRLAYLQGWGEPFCNPHFFEMLHLAKSRGCRVGTSTNGMLLDKNKINRLLDERIDIVTFSLAGASDYHNQVRSGTRLAQIMEHIEYLKFEKEKRGIKYPEIHIAYLLLKSGLEELDKLPALLSKKNVAQVVISTLDFVPSPELTCEKIAPETVEAYNLLAERLNLLTDELARENTALHYHLQHPDYPFTECTENIKRSFFVAVDGAVSPCVFLNLPVENTLYVVSERENPYCRVIFGNVNCKTPAKIWKDKKYRKFRESFFTGHIPECCISCPKRHMS
ncbi:MAG: radical SAM/SPASM domain-containing protein [Candidatus Zixiibacteriota bacterium]